MPKVSIMSIEDYIRSDFFKDNNVLNSDTVNADILIHNLAKKDHVRQAYTEYVTNRISGLNLSDAISTVENVSRKLQNLRDITLPCVTNAVEKCLSQIVDKSSTEDIHHAIELNEEHNLVDLSELDELLYPHAKTQPATSKQLSQVRALTHTPSLADDLQAATQAANRQHTSPAQQSHNRKL